MKPIRITLVILLVLRSGLAWAQAAAEAPSPLKNARESTALEIQQENDRHVSFVRDLDYIALIAGQRGTYLRLLQEFEDQRSDKQVGATSSASGSTTLTSKGTVPKVLGFAVENGAVTQTQSGTTVTFRGNPGGAIRALAGKGFFQLAEDSDPALSILSAVSLSASFDTARGNSGSTAENQVLTADQQQLSQWTGRVQIVNHRDPRRPAFLNTFQEMLAPSLGRVNTTVKRLYDAVDVDAAVAKWVADTDAAVAAAKTAARSASNATDASVAAAIAGALAERETTFPSESSLQTETRAALADYDRSSTVFASQRQGVLNALARGGLLAFEFSQDRPLNGPAMSNFRLSGELGGTVDLTGDVSVTLFDVFNPRPMGVANRVHDVQASGELDIRLGSADRPTFIFALSGKLVHQYENSFDPTSGLILPNTAGNIAVGQIKLIIPAGKGTGARIPLSLTLANRSDLIPSDSTIVRANIGITYDLDVLFARLKP